ncbi:adenosylcobinamide-phosphate synthase CbiB [Pelagicoccus sp. SDUM812002]|uniref:adenosylcobinamide-phosphate synthase CbiB n=1 Tax=Pelagicoccus sp. SDUM812002 TaxID=3041266 RepID=UPI00280EB63E|nr:adenosylcobinamide-phosphate synthase CbiB [Pelagicoccus sp. SDUM812002]MDQ8187536.1 adenosylcobinamide-phosphate synthase CbiB [Pelagicoccus sp. SDUM812002]
MDFAIALGIGVILDFVFGDPRGMPHLVRLVGALAVKGEQFLVRSLGRSIFAGAILWLGITAICTGGYLLLSWGAEMVGHWLKLLIDGLLLFQCIAYRDLVKHVVAVKLGLDRSLAEGRQRVSWIVGRDTERMEEEDVCRAAIESGAENLNDAVIAPLFWFALFGPMGALVFRVSNTMDAMVGHRTERFEKLGKVSARIDDVLNVIPARLCCMLVLKLGEARRWRRLKSDATLHPSFNAGWPEAAMAKRLGVVIGGRMYEKGELVQTAEMNRGARQPIRKDVVRATRIMGIAYAKCLALVLAGWAFASML